MLLSTLEAHKWDDDDYNNNYHREGTIPYFSVFMNAFFSLDRGLEFDVFFSKHQVITQWAPGFISHFFMRDKQFRVISA